MDLKIIGQAFGILATAITFTSYQLNSKKSILITQTVATLCTCICYFLLGAKEGFALNVVCIVRNITFYFLNIKQGYTVAIASLFSAVMIGLGMLTWQGPISLTLIIALAINTLILSLGKPQLLRQSIIFTSGSILIYNIFVFSIGGIANEAISILSSIIGILRYRSSKKALDSL